MSNQKSLVQGQHAGCAADRVGGNRGPNPETSLPVIALQTGDRFEIKAETGPPRPGTEH